MTSIQEWWSAGRRELVAGHHVWVHEPMGSGPPLTLLHGFPSSSHDFAKLVPALAERHTLLTFDLLGFGASDKPPEHEYSIFEQADIVEELGSRLGIAETAVVAHDYSVTVAQELLARGAPITRLVLLNGGLYPDLHRPVATQTALADPVQGPQISAAMTEELFAETLRPTFGPAYDFAQDAADIWAAIDRGGRVIHRLIGYMAERRANAERWVGALESTDVPLAFVWGMLDPISGAHVAERIRERLPGAPFDALEDVAHWPPLEAPDRVVAAVTGRGPVTRA
jgi:pimeloyl-ACP methyl ester carboxylesterase